MLVSNLQLSRAMPKLMTVVYLYISPLFRIGAASCQEMFGDCWFDHHWIIHSRSTVATLVASWLKQWLQPLEHIELDFLHHGRNARWSRIPRSDIPCL